MLKNPFSFFFFFLRTFRPGSQRGDARCTIQCPPALGKIPQLQCKVCLCLYHHECAKKSHVEGTSFTCEVMVDGKTFRIQFSNFYSLFRTVISNSQNHRKVLHRKSIISRRRQRNKHRARHIISRKVHKRL